MKNPIFLIMLLFSALSISAQDKYNYTVDLQNVKNDRVQVTLTVPDISEKEIVYYLPKIIPGTYSIADYGRFAQDFKALDKKGRELSFEKKDDNSWVISKAKKLKKITYWVDDSYDWENEGPEIFQPAGTNIEEGQNFVINPSGFFGYFEGMKSMPFTINIIKPEGFYGGTGLQKSDNLNTTLNSELKPSAADYDVFNVPNYDRLVDSPLMYSKPDTSIIKVADTDVLIAVYSPNKLVTSKEIAKTLEETLLAQRDFLKGNLPVDKYAFIFYFTDRPVTSYGALEHSYSSFYYMPEMTIDQMQQQLRDFAAHEFFHIITPLTIHSKEIHEFDFNKPDMSKHLWLYEGVTEYFAGIAQVQGGLVNIPEYMQMLREKLIISQQEYIDTLAFTDLSKFTLDEYHDQYGNVYQKGALIGMCLDITLLSLSDGELSLRDLVLNLSDKLGANNYFKDDELFDLITEMTYPEIREFFTKYVEGNEPLPYEKYFEMVGINYTDEITIEVLTLGIGNENIAVVEDSKLAIQNEETLDDFGKNLGYKNGDILVSMNGEDVPPLGPSIQSFFTNARQALEVGKVFEVGVERNGEVITLSAESQKVPISQYYIIQPMGNATEGQLTLRDIWLGNN